MARFEMEGLFPELPRQRVALSEIGVRDIEAEVVHQLWRERVAQAQGGVALFNLTTSGEMHIPEELL